MNESTRLVLLKNLESKVELKKQDLRTAIDEGADNMAELMKGLALITGLLLVVYLIFKARSGRSNHDNNLGNKFAARMGPLLSMALQKGAAIFMGEAIDKLVDYLATKDKHDNQEKDHDS